jgi:hypothetical protein
MKSNITQSFRKLFNELPLSVQKQARKSYILWKKDLGHNSLQFKKVSQKQPIYSVRVGINYRALGLIENEQIYWFWIGTYGESLHLISYHYANNNHQYI